MRALKGSLVILLISLFLVPTTQAVAAIPNLALTKIASVDTPVAMAAPADQTGRMFIAEQPGRIRIYTGGRVLATPFLDINAVVKCCGEEGLLGLAFHPDYITNGYLFVYYTNKAGNNALARYRAAPPTSNVIDPSTGQIVFTLNHPTYANHNGGQLQFGPEGYLYVATGDGGGGGDPQNRAQNLSDAAGKILRFNVDVQPIAAPSGNPFHDGSGPNYDPIWHYGLRNPWRFSFDRLTGEMYIGDVGQGNWEEIDRAPAGEGGINFGWRKMEGSHCYPPGSNCNQVGLTLPVLEYPNAGAECAVIGGYRYRGTANPGMKNLYLYGDFCSGKIWGADPSKAWATNLLLDTTLLLTTFGEDQSGELFVADIRGDIYKIVEPCPAGGPGVDVGSFMAYDSAFRGGVFVAAGDVAGNSGDEVVTGAGPGGGPHVTLRSSSGSTLGSFMAYHPGFRGGVRVATADIDGDGDDEIVTGAGSGGGPHVRVLNASGTGLAEWMAYSTGFRGGVFVGSADIDADGDDEVITGAGEGGGPHVRVWDFDFSGSKVTRVRQVGSFFAYHPSFKGGVRVAGGQLRPVSAAEEIITGAGPGGGPHVKVFSGSFTELTGAMAYGPEFFGGVFVAAGDYRGDGAEELITGPGEGGGPHVKVFSATTTPTEIGGFMAYCTMFPGGVRVASADVVTSTGREELVTGAGPGGGPHIRIFD